MNKTNIIFVLSNLLLILLLTLISASLIYIVFIVIYTLVLIMVKEILTELYSFRYYQFYIQITLIPLSTLLLIFNFEYLFTYIVLLYGAIICYIFLSYIIRFYAKYDELVVSKLFAFSLLSIGQVILIIVSIAFSLPFNYFLNTIITLLNIVITIASKLVIDEILSIMKMVRQKK